MCWCHMYLISKFSIRKCLLYITRSISYSDIGKCLIVGIILPVDQKRCVISCLYLCVFDPSVSVDGIVTGMLFTLLHPGRTETDVIRYNLAILYACILCNSNGCLFSSFESSGVYLLQNGLWGQKHQLRCFPMWRRFSTFV